MSVVSMTGFARSEGAAAASTWAWELRSVNGKSLDVRLRVPQGFDAVEAQVRPLVQKQIGRGSVNATLTVVSAARTAEVRINEPVLAAVIEAARVIAGRVDARAPSLDGLLALKGVMEVVDAEPSEDERTALHAEIVAGFTRALAGLMAARGDEGRAIAAVLGARVDDIARLTAAAEACPARQPDAVRARLAEQIRVLLDGASGLDPDRLHQEAVMLAAKADVREELDRLKAHVDQARRLLAEGGAIGRKLDFLSQEFSREANTLCSKANDVSLTKIGLDLKHAIDQFREQVQNIE